MGDAEEHGTRVLEQSDTPMKKFRVAETFGPTVQGEGRNVGTPCYFIRLGGCDFRCRWCDTPHAVLPDQVSQLPQLTAGEIYLGIRELYRPARVADWVVISGGNPALFDLGELVTMLHGDKFQIMVETQGTIWHNWLTRADEVCVSPKPPSAGNITDEDTLCNFMENYFHWSRGFARNVYLKVVVFDQEDFEYALKVRGWYSDVDMFLSVGNDDPSLPTVGDPHPEIGPEDISLQAIRHGLSHAYASLVERCLQYPQMRNVRVLPQLHVLAWGNVRGH